MNKQKPLSEREFEIINIVASGAPSNQRELSVKTGISLGMTNILIRRLVTKGYLRIRQLNQKKVEYLLTPRGFIEKTEKSYRYTLKTIRSLMLIKGKIQKILQQKVAEGHSHFVLVGTGDLPDLMEMVLRNMNDANIAFTRVITVKSSTFKPDSLVIHDGNALPPDLSHATLNMVEALSSRDMELEKATAGV